ncbi:hypothetical protein HPO96_12415 [Kribbella sandramycini]|uniref:Uncharacterized protein n=1 Tax=Kribbella sandramycini TaxID=60450 RepID=A0A7Y4KYJ2_9ACTN|nr:hypothetical protein [Kribbella sandramycini]MBB6569110.1 hypothetical protein [Kribbella sandramycini]NOL41047.1 hypothetical protein [Kribbella sandramycini]
MENLRKHADRRAVSIALLLAAVVILAVGRFIQFDDTSGFGFEKWNRPLGYVAALVAIGAVAVAAPEVKARLWFGVALLVLGGWLVVMQATSDGFRFVWSVSDGELGILWFFLLLLGVVMVLTAAAALTGGRWMLRVAAYLVATVALCLIAFNLGLGYYGSDCAEGESECLSWLGGVWWAVLTLAGCAVLAIGSEVVLWRRRSSVKELVG